MPDRNVGRRRGILLSALGVVAAALGVGVCCVAPALAGAGMVVATLSLVSEHYRPILLAVSVACLLLGASGLVVAGRRGGSGTHRRSMAWALIVGATATVALVLWGDCLVACLR